MMERKPKTIFQLDTPFMMRMQWPEISTQHQDTILELLCNLLSPVGHHRQTHVAPSTGRRSKKRKRREEDQEVTSSNPPAPEIASSIVVGLNAVARGLENLSEPNIKQRNNSELGTKAVVKKHGTLATKPCPALKFSVIFVSSSMESTILQSHLPQLVATASSANPEDPAVRLVQLPKSSSPRLSDALALPRVSFIGLLQGAPHSQALVDYIRDIVPEVCVPWLQGARMPAYLPVKINAIETFATIMKKEMTKAV